MSYDKIPDIFWSSFSINISKLDWIVCLKFAFISRLKCDQGFETWPVILKNDFINRLFIFLNILLSFKNDQKSKNI